MQAVHLSTENIVPALSVGLTPGRLIIITPTRIREIESQKRDVYYLQFGDFVVTRRTVETSLTHRDEAKGVWSALEYECTRNRAEWTCKSIRGFNIGS